MFEQVTGSRFFKQQQKRVGLLQKKKKKEKKNEILQAIEKHFISIARVARKKISIFLIKFHLASAACQVQQQNHNFRPYFKS